MKTRFTLLALVVVIGGVCGDVSAQDARFVRADVDEDGSLNISDAVGILLGLFAGAPIGCEDAVDANDDGAMDVADAIYMLQFLFLAGPGIPAPSGACGADPTPDALGCASFGGCEGCQALMLPENVPLELIWCPPGTFLMGRYSGEQDSYSDEDPRHEVTLTGGFCLGKYEVTKRQWEAVMGTRPWAGLDYVLDDPDSPAVYVSWDDAQAFIAAVNALDQGTFRLPTEAEWEYACRAGTATRFYWGDDPTYSQIGSYAWYYDNAYGVGERYAHVVGQKIPNAWGLCDMSGNVWEWCQDWYDAYPEGPVTDPAGPPAGAARVYRGGSWINYPRHCRSAHRAWNCPWCGLPLGFRLARQ